jgi:DNA replication protein DnaC
MFSLVSARDERASVIVTSNPSPLGARSFGDEVVAAAIVDRLVHHADILAPKGDGYRLRTTASAHHPADRSP